MDETMPLHSSYAALFDPTIALALAARAAQWNLPRHLHRWDGQHGRSASPDVVAFDAAVDLAPIPDEEMPPDDAQLENSKLDDSVDQDFENKGGL